MERLMEIARKAADEVEVYSLDGVGNGVSFENAKLKDIDSKMQSGVALRLFKDGKVGTAYTQNLIDREGLVQNALAALKGGVEAQYHVPGAQPCGPEVVTYDPTIEGINNTMLVDECARLCSALAARTADQITSFAGTSVERIRTINSRGADVATETSGYFSYVSINYPGTYSSIMRFMTEKSFKPMPDAMIDYVLDMFTRSKEVVKCGSERMKVMFLPEAMYALAWRLTEAANAKAFYEKVSPIRDKGGQQVFSDKLTFIDESLNDARPGARAYDDEGTPCTNMVLVDKGVFQNYYCDLFYASKLGVASTGHGYRGGIQYKPHPALEHIVLQAGDTSFAELLKMMDRGVMVAGVLGAHSGNILNGDYSIGLSPGILVENGEIKGQIKDAMVAGNIYETFKNVIAVEDTLHAANMGTFPAVLFDGVSVATRA
jgi:PmbA protein